MGRKKFKKTLTAKHAKGAKKNRGETNFDMRMPCLPDQDFGSHVLYPASPLTFLRVLGVPGGERSS